MINKVKDLFLKAKSYWKKPPEGRYMSYREIVSLSVGGIGVRFIVTSITQMTISVGNVLIGNTIGITPTKLYIIYIISLLSSFPLTALRAWMVDNTRSMKGKYRPYIISMGIPTVLLGIGFIEMPYERMGMLMKCIVVLAFNIGFQFFYNFYFDSYDSLINVLSPNSIERSDALSVRSIIENIAPSVYNIIFPLLAKLVTGENTLYDLKVYRFLYPPMLFFGFLISVMVYTNTEEKIVRAKTHFIQVSFSDALRAVIHNKYFWIISLAGWLGFLEGASANIMQWMYNYQGACSAGQYSLIVAIAGNASFWPNLVAPFLIRKYGKKIILVVTNLLNIAFLGAMLPVVRQSGNNGIIWVLLACMCINNFITSLGHLLTPSVNADIRDYQQYISGERIDGMFAAVGLIGNVITVSTGLVLPAIYERAGLNATVAESLGYSASNVYEVLYNVDYFRSISSVLVLAAVAGAIMNVIPYFFYDFKEINQKSMVRVLKIRALAEDASSGTVDEITVKDGIEAYNEYKKYYGKQPNDLTAARQVLKAEKAKGKAAYKAAKASFRAQQEENELIEIASFVHNELNRFTTPEGVSELETARKIDEAGVEGFLDVPVLSKPQAKALPADTEQHKNIRRDAITLAGSYALSRKTIARYYPDGKVDFNPDSLLPLFDREDEIEKDLLEATKQMKAAKENGSTADMPVISEKLTALRAEKKALAAEIKKATKENTRYHRAVKPCIDARRKLNIADAYSRFDEISVQYAVKA